MKTSVLSSAVLSCLLGAMACGTSAEPDDATRITVQVTAIEAASGQVSGTVLNIGDVTLWFGGCMAGLESKQDGAWKSVPRTWACDQYLGELPPGHSVDFVAELPETGVSCPLRVSAGLSAFVYQASERSVTGYSDSFCPEVSRE
jgi:hypothetical protein